MANTKTKHGCSKNPTKEYKAWIGMKGRCLNPDYKNFKNYGGRGITVDPLWVSSFKKFLEDMGQAPTKQHSLDRIDNERGYTPENCRWATKKEQSRNTRTNRKLLFDGQEMPVAQLAEELGVPAHRIYAAIYKGKR
jgi:hypothetical protein